MALGERQERLQQLQGGRLYSYMFVEIEERKINLKIINSEARNKRRSERERYIVSNVCAASDVKLFFSLWILISNKGWKIYGMIIKNFCCLLGVRILFAAGAAQWLIFNFSLFTTKYFSCACFPSLSRRSSSLFAVVELGDGNSFQTWMTLNANDFCAPKSKT